MIVSAIVPDLAPRAIAQPSGDAGAAAHAFGTLLQSASQALARASDAETAFAAGSGGLQEMVVARAHADIALQVAATAASRTAQGLQTLLGMSV